MPEVSESVVNVKPPAIRPENPDSVRLGIDTDFLRTINPSLDDTKTKESLQELYRHLHESLRLWIG